MSKKHNNYPVRFPRYAAGIRMQGVCTRPDSWWEKRWLAAVMRMDMGGRFGRGRNYAISGQVTDMILEGHHVEARVLGVRPEPYRVAIDFRVPKGKARQCIVTALRDEPMLVARLLANDLPIEVPEIFSRAGCDLFPGGKLAENVYDMTTHCSCPDYANPCKHVHAVLMLLGDEIGRRPMTLLALRGFSERELYED